MTAQALMAQVKDWWDNMPEGRTANWVLGNHDNWRLGTRFGESRQDGFNMVALLLPGVAVTYYGEEIGMVNTDIPFNETVDPQGLNCGKDHYQDEFCSRDFERTPMQWDQTEYAGFSSAKPWLPVNQNYKEGISVSNQTGQETHLSVYKKLASLRKTNEFKAGQLKMKADNHIFAFSRYTPDEAYIVAFYVTTGQVGSRINLTELVEFDAYDSTVIIRSTGVENNETTIGSAVDLSTVFLQPQESIVLHVRRSEGGAGTRHSATWLLVAAILVITMATF